MTELSDDMLSKYIKRQTAYSLSATENGSKLSKQNAVILGRATCY